MSKNSSMKNVVIGADVDLGSGPPTQRTGRGGETFLTQRVPPVLPPIEPSIAHCCCIEPLRFDYFLHLVFCAYVLRLHEISVSMCSERADAGIAHPRPAGGPPLPGLILVRTVVAVPHPMASSGGEGVTIEELSSTPRSSKGMPIASSRHSSLQNVAEAEVEKSGTASPAEGEKSGLASAGSGRSATAPPAGTLFTSPSEPHSNVMRIRRRTVWHLRKIFLHSQNDSDCLNSINYLLLTIFCLQYLQV